MAATETASNKQLVRDLHQRLWGDADLDVIDEVIDEDATTHWGDGEGNTARAIRADAERYFAGFTDVETSIDDVIAEADQVVVRWTTTGTHSGPYGSLPPTGRRIVMTGVDIYRLAAGRVVEAWSMWDGLSVYRQLGLVDPDLGP